MWLCFLFVNSWFGCDSVCPGSSGMRRRFCLVVAPLDEEKALICMGWNGSILAPLVWGEVLILFWLLWYEEKFWFCSGSSGMRRSSCSSGMRRSFGLLWLLWRGEDSQLSGVNQFCLDSSDTRRRFDLMCCLCWSIPVVWYAWHLLILHVSSVYVSCSCCQW